MTGKRGAETASVEPKDIINLSDEDSPKRRRWMFGKKANLKDVSSGDEGDSDAIEMFDAVEARAREFDPFPAVKSETADDEDYEEKESWVVRECRRVLFSQFGNKGKMKAVFGKIRVCIQFQIQLQTISFFFPICYFRKHQGHCSEFGMG